MANIYGRSTIVILTNKTGLAIIAGDVVVPDGSNDGAFTTTTSASTTSPVWIAQESIANNASGRVLIGGYAALVNVQASVTRGHYGATYTVAKQATDGGANRTAGTFCRFLTGGTTPTAYVYPTDLLGTSLTNPMSNVGDLIQGGSAGAPTALAAVATGSVLVSAGVTTAVAWGYSPFHGCSAYRSSTITLTSGTAAQPALDSEDYDTDAYHFTSAANLTGTVTKTASSAALVGSSTLFTSELTVNQVIAIPGTATEIGVVKLITDNTHLTLWQTMANSASGQTVARRNDCVAIPAGMGGKYFVRGASFVSLGTVSGVTVIMAWDIFQNGSLVRRTGHENLATGTGYTEEVGGILACSAGDYLQVTLTQNSGNNATAGDTGNTYASVRLEIAMWGV